MADHVGIIANGRLAYEGALREGTDLEALFMDVCRRAAGVDGGRADRSADAGMGGMGDMHGVRSAYGTHGAPGTAGAKGGAR